MKFFKIIEKSEKYLAVSKKMSNFPSLTLSRVNIMMHSMLHAVHL